MAAIRNNINLPKQLAKIFCLLLLSRLTVLAAQDSDIGAATKPITQNIWQEIYFRIADSFSASSVLELLKSMELEEDQVGLSSSYVVILKDQIDSYRAHYQKDPIHTEALIGFLLDKMAQQAETVAQENPEIANVIDISLIPDLSYNAIMGKANYALGRLGAKYLSESIIKRLKDINDMRSNSSGLSDSAIGCLEALAEFQTPAAFPVLFQVQHGALSAAVRHKAMFLMEQLQEQYSDEVQKHLVAFVMNSANLSELNMVINSMFGAAMEINLEINLALLTRLNQSTWPVAASTDIKDKILHKAIDNILENISGKGAEKRAKGMEQKTLEQLQLSYWDSNNMDIKLLALQAIGQLEKGAEFLQGELTRLNHLHHRSELLSFSDEKILRQLLYLLAEDSSERSTAVLRQVSRALYPAAIHQSTLDILHDNG